MNASVMGFKPRSEALILDDYIPYRLSISSNAVSKLIARAYEDRFGLSIPQWRLMAVLAERPMTQQQIVLRTAMDKVTVSRAAHGLVTRHLVGRAAHEADGRSHILTLTDQGRALHAEIAPLALAYEAALLSGLTSQEVETLKRLLMRLEDGADKLAGEAAS